LGNVALSSNAYVSFQIRFSPELKEKLIRRSYETGISQREIVTEALNRYLAKYGNLQGDCGQAIG
jgi:predicted DNA-binding protein